MAKVLGKHWSLNKAGQIVYTLHLAVDFDDYYSDLSANRGCQGNKVETVYCGTYDCSEIKVGSLVDVSYGKAITTAKGSFQPVKAVTVLDNK